MNPALFASFLFIALLLLISIRGLRNPRQSTKASVALLLVALTMMFFRLGTWILKQLRVETLPFGQGVVMTLGIQLMLAIFVFTLWGIREINLSQNLKGMKRCIGSLCILVLMIIGLFRAFSLQFGLPPQRTAYAGGPGLVSSDSYRFPEYYFEVGQLPRGYRNYDLSSVNPEAILSLLNPSNKALIVVIAENLGTEYTLKNDEVMSLVKENLRALHQVQSFSEIQSSSIDGKAALDCFASFPTLPPRQGLYRALSIGPMIYQINLLAPASMSREELTREMNLFTKEMKFIGELPETKGDSQLHNYLAHNVSTPWHFQDLPNTWFRDVDTLAGLPRLDAAATSAQHGFVVSSVSFPSVPPSDEVQLRMLFYNEDIPYPGSNIRLLRRETEGEFRVSVFSSTQSNDEPIRNIHYAFLGERYATMLSVYGGIQDSQLELTAEQLRKAFHPQPKAPLTAEQWVAPSTPHQSMRLNQAGMYYTEQGNNLQALSWYEQALNSSEEPPEIVLLNAMNTLDDLSRHQQAMDWVARYAPNQDARSNRLKAWEAWHRFHSDEELREQALQDYENLFAKDNYRSDDDLIGLLVMYLSLEESPEAAQAAFQKYKDDFPNRSIMMEAVRIFRHYGHAEASLEELDRLEGDETDRVQEDVGLARLYALNDLGRYSEALELATQLQDAGYKDANLCYHMAQSYMGLRRYPDAKRILEQGLSFSPDNLSLKDELRYVASRLGQGEASSVRQEIPPLTPPKEVELGMQAAISAEADIPASPKGEFSYFVRLSRWQKEGQLKSSTLRRVRITDKQAVNFFSTIEVDFNPLSEQVYLNRLEVFDSQGNKLAEADRSSFFILDEEDRQLATFEKTLSIPVPALQPGCILEYDITRVTQCTENRIPYEDIYFNRLHLVRFSALSLEGDLEQIDSKQFQLDPPTRSERHLVWKISNLPPYQWEPHQPDAQTFLHLVNLSPAKQRWEEISSEYLEQLKEQKFETSSLRQLASTLCEGAQTEEEKIARLAAYVQEHTQYQGIEFGIRGIIPHSPAQVQARKYGDCKDHSVFLQALLREAGIRSHLALVCTDAPLQKDMPSLDQFDHMINVVALEDGLTFIDCTYKHSNLMEVPPLYGRNRSALVLDPENARIVDLPNPEAKHYRVDVHTEVLAAAKDNKLLVKERVLLHGLAASAFRSSLIDQQLEDHKQWLHRELSNGRIRMQFQEVKVKHLEDSSRPLELELHYTRNLPSGSHPISASPWDHYYLNIHAQASRETPMYMAYPRHYQRKLIYPGSLAELEAGQHQSKTLHWEHEFEQKDDNSMYTLKVLIPSFEIPADQFPQVLDERHQLLDRITWTRPSQDSSVPE